jgi:hypothetical protein
MRYKYRCSFFFQSHITIAAVVIYIPKTINQSNTYRTAESESFHNNKVDIAD